MFVDGGYFSKVPKHGFGEPRIDYEAFSDRLCEGAERLRTYYYDCMPLQGSPPTPEESERYRRMDRFVYTLRHLRRFEVRLGRLTKVPRYTAQGELTDEYEQKGVDVLLAVDLVRMSWDHQIQKAVLVTGESDFAPAVRSARDAGVLTQLYYHESMPVHDELLTCSDDRFRTTQELTDSVLLKRRL